MKPTRQGSLQSSKGKFGRVVTEPFSLALGLRGSPQRGVGTHARPFTFVQLVLLHDVILNGCHFLFLLARRLPVFLAGVPASAATAAIVHIVAEVGLDELRGSIRGGLP